MKILHKSMLVLTVIILSSMSAWAQDDSVVVKKVDFDSQVGGPKWNSITIELEVDDNKNPDAINEKYVDQVKVDLALGFEVRNSKVPFSFYESTVTLVTLESGKKYNVIFWMPYHVVEKFDFPKEPKFWSVSLNVGGEDLKPRKENFSSAIKDINALNNFKNQLSKAAENDGILVPSHRSPYGYAAGTPRETPAIVWKDEQ